MVDLRQELNIRRGGGLLNHELDVPGDPSADGVMRRPTHADVHGIHMKNDAVSNTDQACVRHELANSTSRASSYILVAAPFPPCSTAYR